jgi:alpha-N-arabinofuranosidase
LDGIAAKNITGRILTANAINAHNTFDQADVIKPAIFSGFESKENLLTIHLPSKSVVVLEIQ